jgi:aminoglycoside 3-N-acetyltransferase
MTLRGKNMGYEQTGETSRRKVMPDELTDGFQRLGLKEGDRVILHASLKNIGDVDGGAAMVLHRLLGVLGKEGTLVMPAFTSTARHGTTHDNYTKPGCWCEEKESRHIPFIPELQPDKNLGEIAHRLCSWPSSERSRHPAYSFVAVGKETESLMRNSSLSDPLKPLMALIKRDPKIVTLGVGLNSVTALHLAEQRYLPSKFVRERALVMTSKGQAWVDIVSLGCSDGFDRLTTQLGEAEFKETHIGSANSCMYSMKMLVKKAEELLSKDPSWLICGRSECLSCSVAKRP